MTDLTLPPRGGDRTEPIDARGNVRSPGSDPAAAMRYCVIGETRVRMADGSSVRIGEVVPHATPNSDNAVEMKVLDRSGDPVRAEKLFHSGEHETLCVSTREGYELTGTRHHPVLCLVDVAGVPTLLWKVLEELTPGERVALQRTPRAELGHSSWSETASAYVLGAFISDGLVSTEMATFTTDDEAFFERILAAYDTAVGGPREVRSAELADGTTRHEIQVRDKSSVRRTVLNKIVGRSGAKRVPEFVWSGTIARKRMFLRALFTAHGSCAASPDSPLELCYGTRREQLSKDVQQLLLEFGIVSRRFLVEDYDGGEYRVTVTERRDARLFAARIGFLGAKQAKVTEMLDGATGAVADHVPGLLDFLDAHGATSDDDREWLRAHGVDRVDAWEENSEEILAHIADEDAAAIAQELAGGRFYFAEVSRVSDAGVQEVYTLRVATADHSFVTDGFVSHNTERPMAISGGLRSRSTWTAGARLGRKEPAS